MTKLLIALVTTVALVGPTASALEVRDIVTFHDPITACFDINDASDILVMETTRQAASTEYLRAGVCQLWQDGERRYVAETRATDRGGFLPATDPSNVGSGRSGSYFCMGWLIANTNDKDRSKPCMWVFLTPQGRVR